MDKLSGATRTLCAGAAASFLTATGLFAPALAQDSSSAEAGWTQPMTSWGEPDLTGRWPIGHLTGTPLQRPAQYGEREFLTDEEYAERESALTARAARYDSEDAQDKIGPGHWAETGTPNRRTSLIVDPPNGRIPPLTPEGQAIADAMRSSWHDIAWDWVDDFDTWDRCITRGMPGSMTPFMYNNGVEIFQSPGYVALSLEMVHEARIVPTDGRSPLPSEILHWMGESRGRWEGNTLVVVTTNLQPGPQTTNEKPGRHPVSEHSTITERFTMTAQDAMDYEMTFEDPVLYTAPWTVKAPWIRDESYATYEYACHEANYMIRDYINASNAAQAAAGAEGAGE